MNFEVEIKLMRGRNKLTTHFYQRLLELNFEKKLPNLMQKENLIHDKILNIHQS